MRPRTNESFAPKGAPVERPARFDDMVRIAEDIGRQFEFIRVDFYVIGPQIFLGETTLVPNAAMRPVRSLMLDMALGALWPDTGIFAPGSRVT